jgi:TPP-dependent pyruvate/acetoin dehydrogenase alpha subunit
LVYSLNPELELPLYRSMKYIRAVEEEIAKRYPEGKMRCPTHLSIGQESVPGIFSLLVRQDDFCVSTHRGHAHYLAKGGSLEGMLAEIYGKQTGCSKGKGGSMHLADLTVNFMGTSAIVGNSIPVGVGLGLSAKLRKSDQISCVFLGDGSVEEGVFYESVNFAAVRNLPVVFICENNRYSVYSGLSVRQPHGRVIAEMVEAMGVCTFSSKGENLQHTYDNMAQAMSDARSGKGPQFLEVSTYRWREHCGCNFDNHIGYREEAEYKEWFSKDPLNRLESYLRISKTPATANVDSIIQQIQTQIEVAFSRAEEAPFPPVEDAYTGVYA